jgi:TRAP-type uncharacterized transport system substrate-binding protein
METKPIEKWNGFKPLPPRKKIILISISVLVIIALMVWLLSMIHPLPSRTITMACGPEGSSYAVYGTRYQKLLAKEGIKLDLRMTAGGVENLALLSDPKSGVQVGFVEGGIPRDTDLKDVDSLGTLCYEPMWFFSHKNVTDQGLTVFKGKRINVGPMGSDSRALVEKLLKRNALGIGDFQKLELSPEDAANALLKGEIDAMIVVSAWNSPVVKKLITADGIEAANFSRADAYVVLFSSLSKVKVPMGAGDLIKNRPSQDTYLLAAKTSLIVREDMNPALQYLLLETASKIHSRAGIFQKAGEFPASEAHEIDLSSSASHYYKSGQPFLQRYLPFWIAAMAEELVVLLIPVIGLMYPLWKGLTVLYGWGMQRKIYVIYAELHGLVKELDNLGTQAPSADLLARVKRLEEKTNKVRVSTKYIPMLYSLKDTVEHIRERVDKQSRPA